MRAPLAEKLGRVASNNQPFDANSQSFKIMFINLIIVAMTISLQVNPLHGVGNKGRSDV
jgi:hypothetical protein